VEDFIGGFDWPEFCKVLQFSAVLFLHFSMGQLFEDVFDLTCAQDLYFLLRLGVDECLYTVIEQFYY
jgi:hypothetical protein